MRVTFLGWQPPVPAGRDFDLYGMLPQVNRDEDTSGDLQRFISLYQEIVDLLIYDVDRFPTIADRDTAPDNFVAAMLDDLGDPFEGFALATIDKRRLVSVLVAIYQQKGTTPGMVNAVRFFMALTITITEIGFGTWILGQTLLGQSKLGTSNPVVLNTFDVNVTTSVTPAQVAQIRSICDYMKPGNTHLRKVNAPVTPPVYNPLELGISRLDTDWTLH